MKHSKTMALLLVMMTGNMAPAYAKLPPITFPYSEGIRWWNTVDIDGDTLLVGQTEFTDFDLRQENNRVTKGAALIYRAGPGIDLTLIQKLEMPGGGKQGDYFGFSVAISGDKLAVAAQRDDQPYKGQVFLYRQENGKWTFKQKIQGTAPGYGQVDIAQNTMVISTETPSVTSSTVEIYEYEGGTWTKKAEFSEPGGFGKGIAAAPGLIAVGAPDANTDGLTAAGIVHLYRKKAGQWVSEGTIKSEAPLKGEHFGYAVDFNDAGDQLLVGAPQHDAIGKKPGRAQLYKNSNGQWRYQQDLLPPAEWKWLSTNRVGYGKAVSLDSNTAVAGGSADYSIALAFGRREDGTFVVKGAHDYNRGAQEDIYSVAAGPNVIAMTNSENYEHEGRGYLMDNNKFPTPTRSKAGEEAGGTTAKDKNDSADGNQAAPGDTAKDLADIERATEEALGQIPRNAPGGGGALGLVLGALAAIRRKR